MDEMGRTADELERLVVSTAVGLRSRSARAASTPRAPGTWTPLQIVGHLIDSVSNNHQRIVRAALAGEVTFPGYEQDDWVSLQGYAEASWTDLVDLWRLANLRLAAVLRRIPVDRASSPCRIAGGESVTLSWLVTDYLRHVRHHLGQLGVDAG